MNICATYVGGPFLFRSVLFFGISVDTTYGYANVITKTKKKNHKHND